MPVMFRAVLGFLLAALIARAALRTGSLTAGGALAATVIGTAAVAAGWSWGVLLIIYFVSSTLLSHTGKAIKEARTAAIVAKGGPRDGVQVFANGATFAGAALAMIVHPSVLWVALGVGSLAASAADTWATEVGTLRGREPWSILTGRVVPAGTSGAVSSAGTLAALAGAAFIGLSAVTLGWSAGFGTTIVVAGFAGAMLDSLLGETMQARRWCDSCQRETERTIHDCGAASRAHRGLTWMDNDVVNFISSAAAGLLAAFLTR
jgi:uncharacterized protein (TIGR00297 family)